VSKVFPVETASRWVSALACLGILLLTYWLGRFSADRAVGFTAALILMSFGLFILLMSTGNIDTTLTFFTTLSLCLFLRWDSQKQARYLFWAYVSCGLGILAKGPVALIVPWLTVAIWEFIKRRRGEQTAFRHLVWGPLVALGVAALWLIPACVAGGEEYTRVILFKQNIGRALDADAPKAAPWYFFLVNFPLDTLPWFVVFLGGLPDLKTRLKENNRGFQICLLWVCVGFVFFSLMSGKRERYLLPAFPAFSLLLAHIVSRWSETRVPARTVRIAAFVVLAAAAGLLLFPFSLPFLKARIRELAIFPLSPFDIRLLSVYALGLIALIFLWNAFKLQKTNRHRKTCHHIAVACLLIGGMAQVYYIPNIDPVKSARRASQGIQAMLRPGETIAFYKRRYDNAWNFYLNRLQIPVTTLEDTRRSGARYDVIISQEKRMDELQELIDKYGYQVAAVYPVGSRDFVVLRLIHKKSG
jgi:hypothetical protein